MHLLPSSPHRLALSLLFFIPAIVQAQQQPLKPFSDNLSLEPHPPSPLTPPPLLLTSTLVDVLSADPSYSTLIRLLQRTKLIPTLNKLNGSTLFAPTNEAFERASQSEGSFWHTLSKDQSLWGEKERKKPDNILFELRQNLLYHLLNSTLPLPSPSDAFSDALFHDGQSQTLETLLFPSMHSEHKSPVPNPAPPSPWLPERKGLLGPEGQRVRGIRKSDEDWIGVDWEGEGGVKVLEVSAAANGVVVKVENTLNSPRNVAETLLSHPSLTYLATLLSPPNNPPTDHFPLPLPTDPNPIPPFSPLSPLRSSPNQTLFAPSNTAFSRLPRIERSYLESGFASEDIALIVKMHAASAAKGEDGQGVGWRETFVGKKRGEEVSVGDGGKVWVEVDEKDGAMTVGLVEDKKVRENSEKDRVGGLKVVEPDVFCENGVIHIIDDLLLPSGAFQLTTEKTLIGLNATLFVTLLRSANLTSYIDSTSSSDSFTILAPLDSFLDPSTHDPNAFHPLSLEGGGVPRPGSKSLADILRFHVIPGRLRPKDFKDGSLVETEMKLASLKGGRQVVQVGVKKVVGGLERGPIRVEPSTSAQDAMDNDGEVTGETWEEILFDMVEVVAPPIEIGRSIIYLLSSFIEPPQDFVQTSAPDLRLSTFVAASFSSGVDRQLKLAPAVTFFLPRNEAFRSLGLAMSYLLRSDAKEELRRVLKGHVVEEVLYHEDLVEKGKGGGTSFRTLEGGKIFVSPTKDGNVTVSGETRKKDGEKWNGEWRDGDVVLSDMITSNGVIHQVDSVILPSSIDITLAKLLKGSTSPSGSSNKIMSELLVKADLGWVLNGTTPPPSDLARLGILGWLPPSASSLSPIPSDSDDDEPALSFPLSFTLLAPTDEAFAQINLTQYLLDPPALLDLLRLHVIPSRSPLPLNPKTASKSIPVALPPPTDGRPLSLREEIPYLTLLSSSSQYGDLSFREEEKGTFVVGIKGARGSGAEDEEKNEWAVVLESGRATPRWEDEGMWREGAREERGVGAEVSRVLNGVSRGGGVIMISSVLVPFEPTWMMVWGWTVLASVVGSLAALTGLGLLGFWLWKRRIESRTTDYEPLDNEED